MTVANCAISNVLVLARELNDVQQESNYLVITSSRTA
jgi:hypothetical protein